jgi:hypothetical protein
MLFSPCKTRDSGKNKRFGSNCIKAMGWTAKQHENAIDPSSCILPLPNLHNIDAPFCLALVRLRHAA